MLASPERPVPDPPELDRALARWATAGQGLVVALTGAGISAESGIPTFRGADGYWTRGSRHYTPMELATAAAFARDPATVWQFYLERIVRHRDAEPNAGHRALVELERGLGERFQLVTQNVDGLHARAGSDPARTWCIHGELSRTRCAADCGAPVAPLPAAVAALRPERVEFDAVRSALTCACGALRRPHVLWFDEYYDEPNFRFESTLAVAQRMALLLVVGTSGATNLPAQLVATGAVRGVPIVVIGPDDSPFTAVAAASPHGAFLRGTASAWLPRTVAAVLAADRVEVRG